MDGVQQGGVLEGGQLTCLQLFGSRCAVLEAASSSLVQDWQVSQ